MHSALAQSSSEDSVGEVRDLRPDQGGSARLQEQAAPGAADLAAQGANVAVNDSAARVPVGYGDRNPIFYGDEMILHSCKLDKDRVRSVLKYLNQAQIVLDLKPVKHSWEVLGRSVQQLIVALGRDYQCHSWGALAEDVRDELGRWTPRAEQFLEDKEYSAALCTARVWHTLDQRVFTADLTDHLAEPARSLELMQAWLRGKPNPEPPSPVHTS